LIIFAVKFREDLNLQGRRSGTIEGIIVFSNVPRFAQLVGGKHTELGITGGKPLMDCVPLPKNMLQDATYETSYSIPLNNFIYSIDMTANQPQGPSPVTSVNYIGTIHLANND
jgi:hypothetical protein